MSAHSHGRMDAGPLAPWIHPRYQLLERIGQGGMGVVFRARDRLTGQDVALKRVLHPATDLSIHPGLDAEDLGGARVTDPQTAGGVPLDVPVALFKTQPAGMGSILGTDTAVSIAQDQLGLALGREFRTLASLRHPNIVSVCDYGFEAAQQPFFTMELLADARSLLDVTRDMPQAQQVGLLLSILQALTYLHRRGILHREPKSSKSPSRNGFCDASSEKVRNEVNSRT